MAADLLAAAQEIMRLKRIKRQIDTASATKGEREEYRSRKEQAWTNLEAALAAHSETSTRVSAGSSTSGEQFTREELADILADTKTMWETLASVAMKVPGAAAIVGSRAKLPDTIDMVFEQAASKAGPTEFEMICWLAERGILKVTPDRVYYEPTNAMPKHEGDSVQWVYVMRYTPAAKREAIAECYSRAMKELPR